MVIFPSSVIISSMTSQFSALEVEDISTCVLTEWLGFRDRLTLDLVLSGAQRNMLHEVMRRVPMTQPYRGLTASYSKYCHDIFMWMAQRKIYRTAGVWRFEIANLLPEYFESSSIRPILEHMEDLDVSRATLNFDWNLFSLCHSVRSLVLSTCLAKELKVPLTKAVFQQLQKVLLYNCLLSARPILMSLCGCAQLVDVEYFGFHHPSLSVEDQQAVWPYFQRMRAFRNVIVNPILTEHFPQRELGLTKLHLTDGTHADNSAALQPFLRFCPQLTDLTLSECGISFESTISAVCKLKLLSRLQLNYCIITDAAPPTQLFHDGACENLHTLLLAGSILHVPDNTLTVLLRMLGAHVSWLTLSLTDGVSDPQLLAVIQQTVPYLQSLTIDEDSYGQTNVDELRCVFGHIPRLTLNRWTNFSRMLFVRREGQVLRAESMVLLDVTN